MASRTVHVLRIGHRLVRDDRMTTHVCLVARAFGAERIYLFDADPEIKKTITDVNRRWGGGFEVELIDEWRSILREWRKRGGFIVHLTMYGLDLGEAVEEVRQSTGALLLVVGAEKVPREIYEVSDLNVSVGHQPHSEVAALAVFLDRLFRGEELKRLYIPSTHRIVPSRKGKQVETL